MLIQNPLAVASASIITSYDLELHIIDNETFGDFIEWMTNNLSIIPEGESFNINALWGNGTPFYAISIRTESPKLATAFKLGWVNV